MQPRTYYCHLLLQSSLILSLLVLLSLLPPGKSVCWPLVRGLHLHMGGSAPTSERAPAATLFTYHTQVSVGEPPFVKVLLTDTPPPDMSVITWPTPSDFVVNLVYLWFLPLVTLWWLRLTPRLSLRPGYCPVQTPPPRPLSIGRFAAA